MSTIKINHKIFLLGISLLISKGTIFCQDSLFFFQAKSDIEIEKDGKTDRFTAHICFNLKDTLWISFTGTLGIEGVRMLVTPDSTYIINKLDQTASVYPSGIENELIPYAFSIDDWKLLLLNIPYKRDSNTNDIDENPYKGHLFFSENESRKILYQDEKIQKCYFNHLTNGMKCEIIYNEYEKKKLNYMIAKSRKIKIGNLPEDIVQILINYVDYKFNHPQPFVFNFAKYRNGKN